MAKGDYSELFAVYKKHYDEVLTRIKYTYRYTTTGWNATFPIDEPRPKEPEFNEDGEVCP